MLTVIDCLKISGAPVDPWLTRALQYNNGLHVFNMWLNTYLLAISYRSTNCPIDGGKSTSFFSIMRLFGGRKMKPQFIHMPTSSGYIILDHIGVEMFVKLHLPLQFQMTFYIRGHSTIDNI